MKYYVIGTRRYGGCIDEYEVLVTEDKNAAIKEARSEAYIIERDKEKYNIVEQLQFAPYRQARLSPLF